MTKIGYKILTRDTDGTLWSFTGNKANGRTQYLIGQKTYRRDGFGPLAVFDTLESLYNFLEEEGKCLSSRVYRCEYKPSKDTSLWFPGEKYRCYMKKDSLPECTVTADWINLLEEVKPFG